MQEDAKENENVHEKFCLSFGILSNLSMANYIGLGRSVVQERFYISINSARSDFTDRHIDEIILSLSQSRSLTQGFKPEIL